MGVTCPCLLSFVVCVTWAGLGWAGGRWAWLWGAAHLPVRVQALSLKVGPAGWEAGPRWEDFRVPSAQTSQLASFPLQPKPVEVQVITHHMQRYAVWFGGSMLASTVSALIVCGSKQPHI